MMTAASTQQALGSVPAARFRRLQRILVTLGGARAGILEHASVDATEMAGRGIAALIPALFGSLAATVACAYAYAVPVWFAAPAGLAWGLVVLLFDLALMSASPGRGWVSRTLTFGSRGLVSVLAAVTFSGPLVLFMYGKDISTQMRVDQQNDLATYNREHIMPKYALPIRSDTTQVATDMDKITNDGKAVVAQRHKVQVARTQVICEDGGVRDFAGCGQGTGVVGKGNVYFVRVSELRNAQVNLAAARAQLKSDKTALTPQIATLQASIAKLSAQERSEYGAARARYLGNTGLIERTRALGELENAYPGVRGSVRVLEGLIIVVDLSAVIAKLSSRTLSYDRLIEAEGKKVTVHAAQEEEAAEDAADAWRDERDAATHVRHTWLDASTEVTEERIRAWKQVQLAHIARWVAAETGGEPFSAPSGEPFNVPGGEPFSAPGSDGGWRPSPPPQRPQYQAYRERSDGAPIQAPSLGRYVDDTQRHDLMPLPMAPALARAAWIGTGLLAVLGLGLVSARAMHVIVTGEWFVGSAFAIAVALAAYSNGFRRGPAWAHRAAFGTALLGLAMPIVIVLVNL